tara:strand:+ start:987 stop:1337 length:351 start_codon:yes stop_codon:yes gene_type:complete
MLILLNRLFPEDISQHIINIIKTEYIKKLCINKCFVMELMMQNIINKYSYDSYYNIIYDTSNIKQIYDLHNFVIKNDNNMLTDYKVIIKIYYDILKYHNNYQVNWVKNIVEKYIIK